MPPDTLHSIKFHHFHYKSQNELKYLKDTNPTFKILLLSVTLSKIISQNCLIFMNSTENQT